MELSKKIQKLRKERGLTQEEFAEQLFVSRTAVSKWETGRGAPSMASLQMIASLCNVTLDELLRVDEIITVVEQETKEHMDRFAFSLDGMFGVIAGIIPLLPLYKMKTADLFIGMPLYRLAGWQAALYWLFPITMAIFGIMQLAITKREGNRLKRNICLISLTWNAAAVFVLILCNQPYPAVIFFTLLLIRGLVMLLKQK